MTSASFAFKSAIEHKNRWVLGLISIVAPILVVLYVGFFGPFDGWAALVAGVGSAVLTYVLILGIWLTVWTSVSLRRKPRRARGSAG